MEKILIADDEMLIRNLVCDFLEEAGYTVVEADSGAAALALLDEQPDIALCILDIMMPEPDGWETTRRIRKTSDIPIILLSARGEDFDQLTGFDAGADEYVTKPFSPAVLVRRVEALLKRRVHTVGQVDSAARTVWGLSLNEAAHTVTVQNEAVDLTPKEYDILQKLLSHIGRVYSREQLLDDVWGVDFFGDARTVDSHVARLRTKLGEWGLLHLKTVYGVGYKVQEDDDV